MAEWSSYFKQAVANVEQRLDQVLQDSREVYIPRLDEATEQSATTTNDSPVVSTTSAKRSGLAERMKNAVSARSSIDSSRSVIAPTTVNETNEVNESETVDVSDTKSPTPSVSSAPSVPSAPSDKPDQPDQSDQPAEPDQPDQLAEPAPLDKPDQSSQPYQPVPAEKQVDKPTLPTQPEPIDLKIINGDFITHPDLHPLVKACRDLAIAINESNSGDNIKDLALDLVESLEKCEKGYSEYHMFSQDRLTSLHSKIAVLSTPHFGSANKLEQKLALLMDEGQRLSQQELKLSSHIRKLRQGNRSVEEKMHALQDQTNKAQEALAKANADRDTILAEKHELQALAEHYRGQLEPSASATTDKAESSELDASHAALQASWQERELELLRRIADLESSVETSTKASQQLSNRLSERLAESQTEARLAHDESERLQEQIDALKQEKTELAHELESAKSMVQHSVLPLSTISSPPSHIGANDIERFEEVPAPYANTTTDEVISSDRFIDDPSAISLSPPEDIEEIHQIHHGCENGQSELLDRFIDLGPTESPNDLTRNSSLGSILLDVPDRDSILEGPSGEMGTSPHLHLVTRLTRTVRKLESELSATRKAAELAINQREQAQAEMVTLIDAQDDLDTLQKKHSQMETEHQQVKDELSKTQLHVAERDERILELEADVADLKSMYREQVETLVQEIAKLTPT